MLRFFKPEEPTRCVEIGDGNINYVFRIWSEDSGRSLVIKQADKLLRSSGRPLDTFRSRIEAELLRLEFTSGVAPCVILPAEGEEDFTYMVLPVRLKAN